MAVQILWDLGVRNTGGIFETPVCAPWGPGKAHRLQTELWTPEAISSVVFIQSQLGLCVNAFILNCSGFVLIWNKYVVTEQPNGL